MMRRFMFVLALAFVLAPGVVNASNPNDDDTTFTDSDEAITVVQRPEICFDYSVNACYTSVTECQQFQSTTCSTRYPNVPSNITQFNRVVEYEEGRMCKIVCYDRNGNPTVIECTPPPPKRQPKPGDVTLGTGAGELEAQAELRPTQRYLLIPVGSVCPTGYICNYYKIQDSPDGFPPGGFVPLEPHPQTP